MEKNSRKLKKRLESDGWVVVNTEGSHWQFKHPNKSGRLTLPHPRKDISPGVVKQIYKAAGWRKG